MNVNELMEELPNLGRVVDEFENFEFRGIHSGKYKTLSGKTNVVIVDGIEHN